MSPGAAPLHRAVETLRLDSLVWTEALGDRARIGGDQIEAQGLDRPVQWRRAGVTEVFLYIPHRLVFRPAG